MYSQEIARGCHQSIFLSTGCSSSELTFCRQFEVQRLQDLITSPFARLLFEEEDEEEVKPDEVKKRGVKFSFVIVSVVSENIVM